MIVVWRHSKQLANLSPRCLLVLKARDQVELGHIYALEIRSGHQVCERWQSQHVLDREILLNHVAMQTAAGWGSSPEEVDRQKDIDRVTKDREPERFQVAVLCWMEVAKDDASALWWRVATTHVRERIELPLTIREGRSVPIVADAGITEMPAQRRQQRGAPRLRKVDPNSQQTAQPRQQPKLAIRPYYTQRPTMETAVGRGCAVGSRGLYRPNRARRRRG